MICAPQIPIHIGRHSGGHGNQSYFRHSSLFAQSRASHQHARLIFRMADIGEKGRSPQTLETIELVLAFSSSQLSLLQGRP